MANITNTKRDRDAPIAVEPPPVQGNMPSTYLENIRYGFHVKEIVIQNKLDIQT